MGLELRGGITMFVEPKDVNQFLRSIISRFEASKEREMMDAGDKYYKSENIKITERKKLMYMRDAAGHDYLIEDPYKANNKLAAGYYKILIDQKVQYSLGKEVTITTNNGKTDLLDVLGKEEFPKILRKIGKAASKKYIGWAQPYIENGKFMLAHIPSEQVVPVYNPENADELLYALRYYPVQVLNAQDEMTEVYRVEVWDSVQVTYYQQNPDTKAYAMYEFKDGSQNPRPHRKSTLKYGDKIATQEAKSWDRVPLIPFYNNDENLYDLQPVKRHIDIYDVVESDFANNLEDIQDIYWILKGYNGTNIDTFLSEVRKYKTLKVDETGDAKAESIDIPTEARETMLNRLNDDIFKFGRGFDPSKTGDGNITNIVIKSRYSALDLKASEFEGQCREFIDRVIWFLNKFFEITGGGEQIADYDVTFNRSQIFNETEILAANASQQGAVSEDTRLSNHPWVDDIQEEKKKMEAEKPAIVIPDDIEEDIDDEQEGQEPPEA
jgi:SPP1 family phage portal protein